jgi:uncharacterized membrane protein YccC
VSNEAKHVNNTASVPVPGVIPMKAPTTWALLRQHSPQSRQFRGRRDSGRSRSRQLISWVGSVLGQAARTARQFDRSKISIPSAVRNTIGVAVTLILGIVCGHPLVGVTASIGALNAGFASFQGTYRSRAEVVLAASLGLALSAFVGGTIGHLVGADIVITALWGFAAGLLVGLGQTATVVGLQSVIGLVVFSQFTFTPSMASKEAGLLLAGGLLQAILIVAVWPLRRFPAERQTLSAVYGQLAASARMVATGSGGLLAPDAFEQLATVLSDPQPFGGVEGAAFHALSSEAERIRLELTALASARQRLMDSGEIEPARALDEMALAASCTLSDVSVSVKVGQIPVSRGDGRDRIDAALDVIPVKVDAAASDWQRRGALDEAIQRGQALAGQIRSAVRIAAVAAGGNPSALEEPAVTGRFLHDVVGRRPVIDFGWAPDRLATLRANLALSSESCRHAMRLAVTLAVAVGLSRTLSLPHHYWLPLTVMIVLKPDFSATFARGVSRIVGTLVGAGLVTVALAELRPGHIELAVLVLVWCVGANLLLFANYAIYSVCIASLVVTLLAFVGEPELSIAAARSILTVVGAALALIAYVVWPTWAATSLPDRLADLVVTDGRYGTAILAAWADPAGADAQALQQARLKARLARSNAEAVADRWLSEPSRRNACHPDQVLGILAATRTYVQGISSLHSQLPAKGPPWPQVAPFADEVAQAMLAVAQSVRSGAPHGRMPTLRSTQLALAERLGVRKRDEASGRPLETRALILVSETDLLTDSVDTLGYLVGLEPSGQRSHSLG